MSKNSRSAPGVKLLIDFTGFFFPVLMQMYCKHIADTSSVIAAVQQSVASVNDSVDWLYCTSLHNLQMPNVY